MASEEGKTCPACGRWFPVASALTLHRVKTHEAAPEPPREED